MNISRLILAVKQIQIFVQVISDSMFTQHETAQELQLLLHNVAIVGYKQQAKH
jgi:hypothetical protein